MKIALIDNMNNMFFSIARYLKDLGMEADVFIIPSSSMKHFDVSSDTFKSGKELSYIKSFPCKINNINWLFFNKKKIFNQFRNYDFIISTGLSSAYLERVGIVSNIIIPYGSDLYKVPFQKFNLDFSLNAVRSIFWSSQAKYQISAYQKAQLLVSDDGYELYKSALNKLKLECVNIGVPMLYNFEELNNKENVKLWNFLNDYDFIVFNHSRQYWKSNEDNLKDYDQFGGAKRNDKLITAFADFLKTTHFSFPLLVLFEYGDDVQHTKNLINMLNIEDYVKWMPTMNRKNIMYGLQKATFSTNAFRENATDIGGVCYESLAVGVPHLNNCIEAIENEEHKFFQAPMINALSSKDILNVFIDYEEYPEKYNQISEKSKDWFNKNLGIDLAKKYVKLIKLLVRDKSLTKKDKRVKEILDN